MTPKEQEELSLREAIVDVLVAKYPNPGPYEDKRANYIYFCRLGQKYTIYSWPGDVFATIFRHWRLGKQNQDYNYWRTQLFFD
jgi:hypothetical protein